MLYHSLAPIWRRLMTIAALSVFGLGASPADALRPAQIDPSSGSQVAENRPPESKLSLPEKASLADLNEVLEATRAKLEELSKAAANVAAGIELRKEVQALKEDNQRLAAELAQATSRRSDLENAGKLADARIAELSQTVAAGRREAARLEEVLDRLRGQNAELERSLTDAHNARDAANARASKTQSEMTKRLETATDTAARSQAELDDVRQRLDQAAAAAVEAERAREAASSEADALKAEMKRARQELAAARIETERLQSANAELAQQISSLYAESRSATESARQNLILMAEKLAALNTALAAVRSQEPPPGAGTPPAPDPAGGDSPIPTTAAAPLPEPPRDAGTGPPEDGPTDTAMVAPPRSTAPEAGLTGFDADIKALNALERSAAGQDVFSGIVSVNGREVDVGVTAAWDSLPPIGQRSYLDSLLDSWVAATGGSGPAAVRIVDESGQVLLEKSIR